MSRDNQLKNPDSKLTLRNAMPSDVPGICDLTRRVYQESGMQGYPHGAVRGQINHFPQGQFVVLVDDKVVGYCATFRISEKHALRQHRSRQLPLPRPFRQQHRLPQQRSLQPPSPLSSFQSRSSY